MRSRVSRFQFPGVLVTFALGCALGCRSGGQSFDDGSGNLGGKKRVHVDGSESRGALADRPSVRITASDSAAASTSYPYASGAFVGDLDADGYSDFALAVPNREDPYGSQLLHVFYGRSDFPAEIDTREAQFTISGTTGALTPLGDFNGDGFGDFGFKVIDPYPVPRPPGTAPPERLIFELMLGGAERPSGTIPTSAIEASLTDGGSSGNAPWAFQGPGDVNADGYADLIASYVDSTQLLLGRAEPLGRTPLSGNTAPLTLGPPSPMTRAGAVNDLDEDGYADFLLETNVGTTALYYGRPEGWSPSLEPLPPDAVFQGQVQSMGDWDGDGYGDLAQVVNLVEYPNRADAPPLTPVHHQFIVSYGGPQRFQGSVALPRPPADSVHSTDATLALGDVNGDRRLDLIVGSPFNPQGQASDAGVVFFRPGRARPRTSDMAFEERDAALRGHAPGEYLGFEVSASGDANGDGYEDLLVLRYPDMDDPLSGILIFGSADL